MYNFKNDYSVGSHPNILNKLIETNLEPQLGYGEDTYTLEAKEIIRKKVNNPKADVFLLTGGTQTNLIVISFLLRPHEAVISAKTGHISANETGAIEATGHKVVTVDTENGKLNPKHIQKALNEHLNKPHVVKPRMVYISNSTEIGSIYTKKELTELSSFCKSNNLFLYLDGARLGHALTSSENDLTLIDIAQLTDVFYIGATKNGALLGEAVIFNTPYLGLDFQLALKQKGALLAKGRLLAIQFIELFKDDLYFILADHANKMAMKLAYAIQGNGYSFLTKPVSNQIFPILPKELITKLSNKYLFYVWKEVDENLSAIRLIASWATDEKMVDELINDIKQI